MPGILRLIILGLIIWLVIRLYRRLSSGTSGQKPDAAARPVENMVRCEVCGVHIPEKHALEKNHHYYCSQAHLQQDN